MISKLLFFVLMSFGFYFQTLQGQISQANTVIGSGANQIDLTVVVNSQTGTVNFTMKGPSSSWFGIGFSASSMSAGAYGILANVNGGNPQEYLIQGQTTPSLQSNQNLLNPSSAISSGRKTFMFSRNIITGDANDFVFSSAPNTMSIIWAYGSSTSLAYHSNRGVVTLTFTNPCNFPITNLGTVNICTGDSVLIFGNYQTQSGNYYDTLSSQFGCDSVLSKQLIVNQSIVHQLQDVSICNGDSVSLFGKYHHLSGTYYDTIIGSGTQCDSIIWVNLLVQNAIDTSVLNNSSTLTCNATADSYQWFDCQTNQPIFGANQISFTPNQTGNYYVEITEGACSQRTGCHFVLINSITGSQSLRFELWPNPASDFISISLDRYQNYQIEIIDLQGKNVLTQSIAETQVQIDISNLNKGLYFVVLTAADESKTYKKLIKR